MKTKAIVWALVLSFGVSGFLFWGCNKGEQSSQKVSQEKKVVVPLKAKITMKIGKVYVYKAATGKKEKAYVGMQLEESDKVILGKNSSAVLETETGSIIKLQENTEFSLAYFRKVDNKEQSQFDLKIGKVLLKPREMKSGEVFEVKTPTAVAGVRGTVFLVEANKNKDTKVAVYKGKVYLRKRVPVSSIVKKDDLAKKIEEQLSKEEVIVQADEFAVIKKKEVDKVVSELKDVLESGEEPSIEKIEIITKEVKKVPVIKGKLEKVKRDKIELENFVKSLGDFAKDLKIEEKPKYEMRLITLPRKRWAKNLGGSLRGIDVYYKGTLYTVTEDGKIYGINQNGRIVFEKSLPSGISSSPVVYKDVLYVGTSDGNLYAISIKTGKTLWKVHTGSIVYGAKVLVRTNDGIYVASSKGQVTKLTFNGVKKWVFAADSAILGEPYFYKDRIYFGTENNKVYSISSTDGKKIWVEGVKARIVSSSPIVLKGVLFIGDYEGNFYAFDADSGKKLWEKKLSGRVTSTPVFYMDRIFVGTTDGMLYSMNLDGKVLWEKRLAGRVEVDPVVYKNTLIVPAGEYVYTMSAKTGNILWKFMADSKITTSPVVVFDKVYIGDLSGNLYSLNMRTRIYKKVRVK